MPVKVEGQNRTVNVGPGAQGNREGLRIQHNGPGASTHNQRQPQVAVSGSGSVSVSTKSGDSSEGEGSLLVGESVVVLRKDLAGNTGKVVGSNGKNLVVEVGALGRFDLLESDVKNLSEYEETLNSRRSKPNDED